MLAKRNIVFMVTSALILGALSSGRFAFAPAAWIAPLPLLVLVRTAPPVLALAAAFLALCAARLLAWSSSFDGLALLTSAALSSLLSLLPLVAHRLAYTFLPRVGAFAFPAAIVVLEAVAQRSGLPFASTWALHAGQGGDGVLQRFSDVLSLAGISFCVAWVPAVMAGFGEAHLVRDVWPQPVRERGLRLQANLCFWLVVVVFHGGGLLRGPVVTAPGTHDDVVALACGAFLMLALVGCLAAWRRLSEKAAAT